MAYDDRSVKGMSSSFMRARIGTKILATLYETAPSMVTSAIRLMVELPGSSGASGPPYPFHMAISPAWCSGVKGARLVGDKKIDVGWLNPSAIASMAYHGKGPFRRPYPLRALAVHPSWDRLVFAVSGKLGIHTMEELKEKRPALCVSVAANDCVDFAIKAMLRAHGMSLKTFTDWGGSVEYVVRPSNPRRRDGIASGEVTAVIDEGLTSWAAGALEHGMVFLPFTAKALARLERYGFQRAPLNGPIFTGKHEAVEVVDFSGWPIVTHADFPEELAFEIARVQDQIREEIPYDTNTVPSMASLCSNTEEGPLDFPLHPGAERYYREKGYL